MCVHPLMHKPIPIVRMHAHTQNDYTGCHIPDLSSYDFHVFGLQMKAVDGHHTLKCCENVVTTVVQQFVQH